MANLGNPAAELTGAEFVSGVINGDPIYVSTHFILDTDIPANTPVVISADTIKVSDENALPLIGQLINLVIQTEK